MTATLEQLRIEHRQEFIGAELAVLLARVAAATCRTYPPSYSDAGVWNAESVQDALQDWTAERLIGRGDLTALLAGASSVRSLRAGLTRSFGQFLTNRRRRSTATNLYKRMVDMLRTADEFQPVGSGRTAHEQLWTLAADPRDTTSEADMRTLLQAAVELADDELQVIRYGPYSLKSSPVLRKPALKRFLVHVLERADGALTPADLMDIIRIRFGLVEPQHISLDDDVEQEGSDVIDHTQDRLIAQAVAARLGEDLTRTLRATAGAGSLAAAATEIGVAEPKVHGDLLAVLQMIAEHAEDEQEAARIYDLVVETLFGEDT